MTLQELEAQYKATPDPDDVPHISPKERERQHAERSKLRWRCHRIRSSTNRVARTQERISKEQEWHDHLESALAAVETELKALDLTSFRPGSRELDMAVRRRDGLTASLDAIERGVLGLGDMDFTPLPLAEALRARGVVPLPGQRGIFAGRSSLLATRDRLAELRSELFEAQSVIDSELRAAEQEALTTS